MIDDDFNSFDASRYADSVDSKKLADLWAKVEVAKIMTDRAANLTRQVYSDLEFYKMTSGFKDDLDD
jgi:hypothetical protein